MKIFKHQGSTSGLCGVHALHNSLSILGSDVTFQELEVLSSADTRGYADDSAIQKTLRKLGHAFSVFDSENEKSYFSFLKKEMRIGNPVITWVNWDDDDYNDGGHWVVLAGKHKSKFIVIDSNPKNGSIVSLYTKQDLRSRMFYWIKRHSDEHECVYTDSNGELYIYHFYGISVDSKGFAKMKKDIILANHVKTKWLFS